MIEEQEETAEPLEVPDTFRAGVHPDQFSAEIDLTDAQGTVAVTGEVDVLTAPLLWERLQEAIDATRGSVVVDLGGVRFIDSMGLGTLVRAHKRLCEDNRMLLIRSPDDRARKLFALTGLDNVFTFESAPSGN
jgi:anti-sigma B factor antagonist